MCPMRPLNFLVRAHARTIRQDKFATGDEIAGGVLDHCIAPACQIRGNEFAATDGREWFEPRADARTTCTLHSAGCDLHWRVLTWLDCAVAVPLCGLGTSPLGCC